MPRGMTLEEERWLVNSHTCANEMVGDTCRVCFLANKLAEVERERDDEIKAARSRWFALDAERAHSAKLAERVAELEQMYAEMKDAADKGSKSVFALAAEQAENVRLREVHVVFDGPPSHESGRFVECEDGLGNGISAGKWVQVGDLWHLVIANVLGPEVKP